MSQQQRIERDLDKNVNYLKEALGVGESFDIIFREYQVGRRRAASFSINGMTNDILLANVFKEMIAYEQEDLCLNTMHKLFYSRSTHSQVKLVDNMQDALVSMLSGELIFLVDKEDQIIVFDARLYPARQPDESNIEKVTRGSRDSFVETLPFNTSLIRRRLRDPNLRFEIVKVGIRSQTDIAVGYIKDITNKQLVETIKEKLNDIKIDGIPMAEKAVEEYIIGKSRWNPFHKVRYTERPDVAAVHLLEGHVWLLIDTSPSIMILPTTLWHHIQHVEEFHQQVVVGSYLRLVRLFGILLSLLLSPLWVSMVLQRHILSESLAFLGLRDPGAIPLALQFVLAEIGFEIVRMATVHVPTAQSSAIGFIGAFMLGEFATKVGLFSNETIFLTAIAAVGSFATPSMEFALAVRLFRIILLFFVMLFKFPGFIIGIVLLAVVLLTTNSFGVSYLWPVIPFSFKGIKDVFFRLPIPSKVYRPRVLEPKDTDRLESDEDKP